MWRKLCALRASVVFYFPNSRVRISRGGRLPQPRMASWISRSEAPGLACLNSLTSSRIASFPIR